MCKNIDCDNAAEGGGSQSLILDPSCLAGLHPDGCREYMLHVAIVSSCVLITRIFPMRQLWSTHKPVRSYEEFLQYLPDKEKWEHWTLKADIM